MFEPPTKYAFITGSGRRIGRQLAYAFAGRGYNIVLHAHEAVDEMNIAAERIEKMGLTVIMTHADLSDAEQVRRLAVEVVGAVPRLDVLINNAGVFPAKSFEDVTVEDWDRVMAINARSQFFLIQGLAPLLKESQGSVINLASTGAYGSWLKHIPYNVSKAAVAKITEALAKQLAPGVRVNAIAPGIIIVPDEEEREHIAVEKIPLQRYGSTEELCAAALYLAEEATYLTGHVLPVDGGVLGAT